MLQQLLVQTDSVLHVYVNDFLLSVFRDVNTRGLSPQSLELANWE